MKVLALDTALNACSVAVVDVQSGGFRVMASASSAMVRGHAEALVPMVAETMAQAELSFTELDRIGVTIGPGTFTGTRIGVAAARGFGLASAKTVVGVTTLQAVACNWRSEGMPVAVFFDASRGEVYGQVFTGCDMLPVGEPLVLGIHDAARVLPDGDVALIGSGAHLVANALPHRQFSLPEVNILPDPVCVAVIAARSTLPPLPLYLRPPDAKPQVSLVSRAGQ
ncbi:tRNA threonylcarbamoyl adenosine modification protein YeaZ [Rhodoligotrophos appendicifer]|uniref:tRNA (adenosine(37)-N6)-threonylcarbamoyltransferase complex dimerization subunit type 1 TsaB n=1 Tax=Rhodoligotrophos appendicifer TaxID=987056 RepID=UPI00117E00AB|nr:tRNA (adenosine(37)-N6)-threonylcarbamoyltransferase complex dimerization subunit type 1 TsaB [Rhodoligotrophos appendicifer]